MFKQFKFISNKSRVLLTGTVSALALMIAGTVTMASPQAASAASCDQVNIVHCGIDGSSPAGYINSFKQAYNNGSDNGHNDLKAIYRWAGATDASVNAMNTSNSKMGILYRNGTIKINGETVANNAWVTARFNSGAGFQEVSPGVWARKTTTSFAQDQTRVIVHFNSDGTPDFAVMTDCGNAIKLTPTPTPSAEPVPSTIVCKDLRAQQVGTTRRYTFVAKANASFTQISQYSFEFGDGDKSVVKTSNAVAGITHEYAKDGKRYVAQVTVKSTDGKEDTGPNCKVVIKTPEVELVPTLVCTSLTQQQIMDKKLTYRFVAKATAKNTAITSYVFIFSDGTKTAINTAAMSATTDHTFAKNNTVYVTSVVVNSKDKKNVTSNACKVSLTTTKIDECKPGVPVGSPACDTPTVPECKPGVPEGSPQCEQVPMAPVSELVHTGPAGLFAAFALTSIAGMFFHRKFLRTMNS